MTYTTDQLKQVLKLHAVWLGNRAGGERADLKHADLKHADLGHADLHGANLYGADLGGADLHGADLHGANLGGADLPVGFKVARLDFGGWSIYITPTHTTIGCQLHPNKDWLKWNPKDVAVFEAEASKWWKQHGAAVKAVIKDVQS